MQIIRTISEMQQFSQEQREKGKKISFVPTMGFLHEGHLSLIEIGRSKADIVISSIFVNPTQFGPNEDFKTYPRDEKGDFEKLESVKTNAVFVPTPEEIYPDNFQTTVHLSEITQGLCGKSRPTHFDGVSTVVLKLFHIVNPDYAIFGEKDYQQLALIRQMAKDLHLRIEIIGAPILRNEHGLALSSRNSYLSDQEQKEALVLSQAIVQAQKIYQAGETKVSNLIEEAKKIVRTAPSAVIDYLEIVDSKTLKPLSSLPSLYKGERAGEGSRARILLAVKIGKTRLIDNGSL